MGEVPICLIITSFQVLVSVQVRVLKQARQEAAPLSVTLNTRWSICLPPTPQPACFVHYLGEGGHLLTPLHLFWSVLMISLCTDGEFHMLLNTGTARPLPLSQVVTWVSSCPCQIKSLPSFEPVVMAAAVVPDARPTGLECFPALPGILSPLGFSMFAVFCISGSYCQCLKELSWYHCSGFSMMDLFFHCHRPGREEHKEIRQNEWESTELAPRKQCPAPSSHP